ncbi:MAG: hypothetical protein CMI90_06290 [Pelagibacteraceae bacterium]|nr:hypothetical protein [Pelagibacteraceae bacterium]
MKTKIVTILFSFLLGGSFLFMGFNRFISPDYILKVEDEKISTQEFARLYDIYKSDLKLNDLKPQEDIVTKINYLNQLIDEIVLKKYLKSKIQLNDKSLMTILKKSLGEDQNIKNLNQTQIQTIMDNLKNEVSKEIFLKSLEAELFRNINLDSKILKEKQLEIFKLKEKQINLNEQQIYDYDANVSNYKIELIKVNLKKFVIESIINEEIINNYYEENKNLFTTNAKYSYEQIIINDTSSYKEKFEDYKNDNNIYDKFSNIEESKIIPNILKVLKKLKENEKSNIFEVGNLKYIIKLNKLDKQKIQTKEEVKNLIINNISKEEIASIDSININTINNSLIENEIIYTNDFLFNENLDYEINESNQSGSFKDDEYFIEYKISKIELADIPENNKNKLISQYTYYEEINKIDAIDIKEEDLEKINKVRVNYFTSSAKINNELLSEDQLNRLILIKNNEPIKINIKNKIYVIKQVEETLVEKEEIENLILNVFYKDLLNGIKSQYLIEVNNLKLLN